MAIETCLCTVLSSIAADNFLAVDKYRKKIICGASAPHEIFYAVRMQRDRLHESVDAAQSDGRGSAGAAAEEPPTAHPHRAPPPRAPAARPHRALPPGALPVETRARLEEAPRALGPGGD